MLKVKDRVTLEEYFNFGECKIDLNLEGEVVERTLFKTTIEVDPKHYRVCVRDNIYKENTFFPKLICVWNWKLKGRVQKIS